MARWSIAAVLLAMWTAAGAENLIRNSGFEDWTEPSGRLPKSVRLGDGQAPAEWQFAASDPVTVAPEHSVVHSGDSALRITKESTKRPVEVQYFLIELKPNTTYRFSVWVRGIGFVPGDRQVWAAFLAGTPRGFWSDKIGLHKYTMVREDTWSEMTGTYRTREFQTVGMIRLAVPAPAAGTLLVDDFTLTEVAP